MAGYLNFQTGQVLTAAQVNGFLMEQATMTFADAAARDAALAGVLREGLLTYNLDTNRLEVYDGTDWVEPAPEPPAGIGSNVVSTVFDTTIAASVSGDYASLYSVTITPTSATSKVLILASCAAYFDDAGDTLRTAALSIFRDSTNLAVPSSAGSRVPAMVGVDKPNGSRTLGAQAMTFLDAPSTTSSVTYSVQRVANSSSGIFYLNRAATDADTGAHFRSVSSITAIEVAA